MGDGGGGHWLVRMEWRPAGWSMSASVNLPLHHKVQKFSSVTGSPGWSRKKGRKMVVCVYVCYTVHYKFDICIWLFAGIMQIIYTHLLYSYILYMQEYVAVLRCRLLWLWSPYGIGQTVISFRVISIFFVFFPRLISAVGDWMSTILRHMVWP